jgi:hypothetical protein
MMGIAMDDTDDLFGFGPGAEIAAPRLHPHLGWIALVTNFQQSSSAWVSSYADRKVYTKYALRDFLAGRYGTISALNSAWHSTYTSFDSAGGWGVGSGLLDENGRNPWVGRWEDEMATATPGVRADLSDFLYLYARQYFSVMARKMRQYAPQHLVFGPAALNGWQGLTRKEILRAAGEQVDVLQCAIGSQQAVELTATYAGNKPLVTWDSFIANADSALWRYPNPEDLAGFSRLALTQAQRGQTYADKVTFLFNAKTPNGVYPVAGIKLWSWTDHWWEKANFGLVSFSDNAYNGREAVVSRGNDPWGWPTGGEERNYGDFLSPVTDVNVKVTQWLAGTPAPAPAPLPPPPPCTDCEHYTETLAGIGDRDYFPDNDYYYSKVTGEHKGWLRGPDKTNFNLYLIKWTGSSWLVVAQSTGLTSDEQVTYVGSPGYYTWRVLSLAGSGNYDFWMKQP